MRLLAYCAHVCVGAVLCGWVGAVLCGWVGAVLCGWVGPMHTHTVLYSSLARQTIA